MSQYSISCQEISKDCKGTPLFHQLDVDSHHVVIQSLILPSHLGKLWHYGRCSAGQLRGSTFALRFITMGSLRHVAPCTGSYDFNNAPPPPPKKRWWIRKKIQGGHQAPDTGEFSIYYAEFLFRHGASFKLHIFSYNSFTPFFLQLEFLMKTLNM